LFGPPPGIVYDDADGRLVKIYSGNDWRVADVLADLREANGR